jgi:hypothetical protein
MALPIGSELSLENLIKSSQMNQRDILVMYSQQQTRIANLEKKVETLEQEMAICNMRYMASMEVTAFKDWVSLQEVKHGVLTPLQRLLANPLLEMEYRGTPIIFTAISGSKPEYSITDAPISLNFLYILAQTWVIRCVVIYDEYKLSARHRVYCNWGLSHQPSPTKPEVIDKVFAHMTVKRFTDIPKVVINSYGCASANLSGALEVNLIEKNRVDKLHDIRSRTYSGIITCSYKELLDFAVAQLGLMGHEQLKEQLLADAEVAARCTTEWVGRMAEFLRRLG